MAVDRSGWVHDGPKKRAEWQKSDQTSTEERLCSFLGSSSDVKPTIRGHRRLIPTVPLLRIYPAWSSRSNASSIHSNLTPPTAKDLVEHEQWQLLYLIRVPAKCSEDFIEVRRQEKTNLCNVPFHASCITHEKLSPCCHSLRALLFSAERMLHASGTLILISEVCLLAGFLLGGQ